MFMPLAQVAVHAATKAAPSLGRCLVALVLKTLATEGAKSVVKETAHFVHRKLDRKSERSPRKPAQPYRACA